MEDAACPHRSWDIGAHGDHVIDPAKRVDALGPKRTIDGRQHGVGEWRRWGRANREAGDAQLPEVAQDAGDPLDLAGTGPGTNECAFHGFDRDRWEACANISHEHHP
jgi:hypothetical protein